MQEERTTEYLHAAAFKRDVAAKAAYYRIQELIRTAECSLSVYNSIINGVPVVTVIGNPPPEEMDQQVRAALSKGKAYTVPAVVRAELAARSLATRRSTTWLEGHYQKPPGSDEVE